jgi:hypothetical protein
MTALTPYKTDIEYLSDQVKWITTKLKVRECNVAAVSLCAVSLTNGLVASQSRDADQADDCQDAGRLWL